MESIGHQVIAEIIKQGMFVVNHPDPENAHVFVWSSGAAEQIEAVIDQKIGPWREALKAIASGRDEDALGACSMDRETMQSIAREVLANHKLGDSHENIRKP